MKEENKGARKTQTLRMSMVMWKKCKTWYRTAEVIISPGEREQRHGVQVSLTLAAIKGVLFLTFILGRLLSNNRE